MTCRIGGAGAGSGGVSDGGRELRHRMTLCQDVLKISSEASYASIRSLRASSVPRT